MPDTTIEDPLDTDSYGTEVTIENVDESTSHAGVTLEDWSVNGSNVSIDSVTLENLMGGRVTIGNSNPGVSITHRTGGTVTFSNSIKLTDPTIELPTNEQLELGSKTYSASIEHCGAISPETHSTIGHATIEGDFHLKPGEILSMEVAGLGPGEHGYLEVLGDFNLEGTVRLMFTIGFAPSAGDIIPLLKAHGSFAVSNMTFDGSKWSGFEFLNLESELSFQLNIDNGEFGIRVLNNVMFVPEPSFLSLCGVFFGMLAIRRPRPGIAIPGRCP